ncbi:hypothetical protein EFP86_02060 [Lentilactobacillus hilgardii]|nr:hypothetical protein [Lentilactobacillus hilgardii]
MEFCGDCFVCKLVADGAVLRYSVRNKAVNIRSVRRSFRKSRSWIFEKNALHAEGCFEEQF